MKYLRALALPLLAATAVALAAVECRIAEVRGVVVGDVREAHVRGIALGAAPLDARHLLPVVAAEIPHGSAVVARKPHLAFHTGAEWIYLPDLASVEELLEWLRRREIPQPTYLFYGQMEREHRPQYLILQSAAAAPDRLEVVAASAEPREWILYRYRP